MANSTKKSPSARGMLLDLVLIGWCGYQLWRRSSGWGMTTVFVVVLVLSLVSLVAKLLSRGIGVDERSAAELAWIRGRPLNEQEREVGEHLRELREKEMGGGMLRVGEQATVCTVVVGSI